ncbi:MAG: hypothetical protein R3C10_17480 [Pirellulales bacterium]
MTAAPRSSDDPSSDDPSSDDPSSDGPPPDTPSATSSPSRTLRIELAYDGGDYAGWQIQPGQPTVQAALEASFAELAGQRVPVVGSGRTDAGVHALAQVASCRTTLALPCRDIARALNARLPDDIIVRQVSDAPADFSALHSAKRKRYAYLIHNRPLGDVFCGGMLGTSTLRSTSRRCAAPPGHFWARTTFPASNQAAHHERRRCGRSMS